jgi:hypothetical protein
MPTDAATPGHDCAGNKSDWSLHVARRAKAVIVQQPTAMLWGGAHSVDSLLVIQCAAYFAFMALRVDGAVKNGCCYREGGHGYAGSALPVVQMIR